MRKISASTGGLHSSSGLVTKICPQFRPGEIEFQKIQDPESQTPASQPTEPAHPEKFSGSRESVPDGQGENVATPDSFRSHLPRPLAQADGIRMTVEHQRRSQQTTTRIMGSSLMLLLVRRCSSGVKVTRYQVKCPVIRAVGQTIGEVGVVLVSFL